MEIKNQLAKLGKISFEEKMVLTIFSMTALAWVSRSFIINKFIPVIDDSIIAISASLLLFVLPSKNTNKPLMTWEDAVKLPWGILLLFGGGMALARGFGSVVW
jgi:sodium-dependent dicarboxylate transporter 2/3/5